MVGRVLLPSYQSCQRGLGRCRSAPPGIVSECRSVPARPLRLDGVRCVVSEDGSAPAAGLLHLRRRGYGPDRLRIPSRFNSEAAHVRENRRRWAWADPLDMGGSRPEGYRLRTAISVVPRNIDGSQKGNMQSARGQTVVIRSGSFRVQRCGQWLGSAHETMLARKLQPEMRTNS